MAESHAARSAVLKPGRSPLTTSTALMANGPIHRSPSEIAEYLATHREARIDAGARIIDGNSIRARLAQDTQDRLDAIIHRESEHGAFDLEAVRELYKGAI